MVNRFKKVRELFQADKPEEAHEWLEAFLKKHPNDAQAYLNLSLVLISLGKTKKSLEAQRRAFKIDPNCSLDFSRHSIVQGDYVLTKEEEVALMDALNLSENGKSD
jgi:tetratricopeptide (TPR) repeat protein